MRPRDVFYTLIEAVKKGKKEFMLMVKTKEKHASSKKHECDKILEFLFDERKYNNAELERYIRKCVPRDENSRAESVEQEQLAG